MKKEIKTRVTAGVLSAVMLCAAVPVTTAFSSSSAGIVSAAEDDGTTEMFLDWFSCHGIKLHNFLSLFSLFLIINCCCFLLYHSSVTYVA